MMAIIPISREQSQTRLRLGFASRAVPHFGHMLHKVDLAASDVTGVAPEF